jgi:hypothetical protein
MDERTGSVGEPAGMTGLTVRTLHHYEAERSEHASRGMVDPELMAYVARARDTRA